MDSTTKVIFNDASSKKIIEESSNKEIINESTSNTIINENTSNTIINIECSTGNSIKRSSKRIFNESSSKPESSRILFNCQSCKFSSTSKSGLTNHCKSKHPSLMENKNADSTNTENKNADNKNTEKQTEQDRILFKCQSCKFSSTSKSGLTNHIKNKHQNLTENKNTDTKNTEKSIDQDRILFKCQSSKFSSTSKSGLTNHFKRKHQNTEKSFEQINTEDQILIETKNTENNFTEKPLDKVFVQIEGHKCLSCNFQATNGELLQTHNLEKHTNKRKRNHNNNSNKDENQQTNKRRRIENKKTNEQKTNTNTINKQTDKQKRNTNTTNKQKGNPSQKKKETEVQQKAIGSSQHNSLEDDIINKEDSNEIINKGDSNEIINTEDPKYFCSLCQRNFMNARSLKFHTKSSHTGTAKKIFSYKVPSHLSTSKQTIQDEIYARGLKAFQCNICSMKFGQRYSLNRHTKSQHHSLKKSSSKILKKKKNNRKPKNW
jgi:hypothetical protein